MPKPVELRSGPFGGVIPIIVVTGGMFTRGVPTTLGAVAGSSCWEQLLGVVNVEVWMCSEAQGLAGAYHMQAERVPMRIKRGVAECTD